MFYLNLNCWFCNKNSRISFLKRNSWSCPECAQYNGFNQEGDYNKEIDEMYEIKQSAKKNKKPNTKNNCLCEKCSYYQQLKVEKLANFVPKNEQTFDLEAELYQEYLEKIYDLCANCKSKVKFEITKQDGILKQYLLNLGKFDYFFEFARQNKTTPTNKKVHKKRTHFLGSIRNLARFVGYAAIFLMSLLLFLYNDPNTDLNRDDYLSQYLTNFTNFNEWIEKSQMFIFDKTKFLNSELKIFQDSSIFSNQANFSNFLNSTLTKNLIVIYLICCLLFATASSNKKLNLNSAVLCFISVLDLGLMFVNHKQFLTLFKTNLNENKQTLGLKYVNLAAPAIHLSLLILFTSRLWTFLKPIQKKIEIKKKMFPTASTRTAQSPFLSSFSQQTSSEQFVKEPVKLNYSFNKAQSYSMMKFLQSNSNNSMPKSYGLSKSCVETAARSLIQPAKFKPAENFFTRPTNQKNSLNDSSDESDESSIVSGLTNLYLNKTGELNQHRFDLNELIDSIETKQNLNTSSDSGSTNFYSSFYQHTNNNNLFPSNLTSQVKLAYSNDPSTGRLFKRVFNEK